MKDLCFRNGLKEVQGREIVRSQFKKVKSIIEEYDYDNRIFPAIRLPKWGLFFVKPSKKKSNEKED